MIPLRDVIPSRTIPFFTIAIIVVNAAVFLFELSLRERSLTAFMFSYGVVPARLEPMTVVTSTFLHAGWMHFLGNMLYLWIFGDNVEDRLGHARFLLFYLLCGAAAALAHVWINPQSAIPTVGASGAIAGVMGAYFVLYPHSRVLALVPLFVIWEIVEVPAIFFLGIWFLMQFFSGVGSLVASTGVETGGVAFWAHIAGFVAGVAAVLVLRKPSRSRWAI
jgi:membrane associated rhomboid family serine protease